MNPKAISLELNRGIALQNEGKWLEAEKIYSRLCKHVPRNFELLHLCGLANMRLGAFQKSIDELNKAKEVNPKSRIIFISIGLTYLAWGKLTEAKQSFEKSLELEPNNPEVLLELGKLAWREGELKKAAELLEYGITLKPLYAESFEVLGALYTKLDGYKKGEFYARKALELEPNRPVALCNLGICVLYQGNISEAASYLYKAVEIEPKLAQGWSALGFALQKAHRLSHASVAYKHAIQLDPYNYEAHSNYLYSKLFSEFEDKQRLEAYRTFGEKIREKIAENSFQGHSKEKGKRLRLGFVSPDFRNHSVSYFLIPMLENLAADRFSIYLYYNDSVIDTVTERYKAIATKFTTIQGILDDVCEKLILGDNLDILFDLAGHTGFNRLPLIAKRLAPIQIAYLGYPETTGLSALDYRFVDSYTDPVGRADEMFTEKLVRFSSCAWNYLSKLDLPDLGSDRTGPIVFGCFNNIEKVTDSTLLNWSILLKAIPESKIVFKAEGFKSNALLERFKLRLTTCEIPEHRVELWPRTATYNDHMAGYNQVDIALDTSPYNGTTTTCEALLMGVPVITLAGDLHISRVGVSLLTAIGHPEWIANNVNDYLQCAALTAQTRPRTKAMRETLSSEFKSSIICQNKEQSKRFSEALTQLWITWCSKST